MNIEMISIFLEMTVLKGRGRLPTKVNITFFVGNETLKIFYLTIFLKNTVFSKITAKNNVLEGMSIFEGKRCRTTKINITFSMENGAPNII